jgi:hypothetical protein
MTEHEALTQRSTICSFPGCGKPVFGHGLCQGHCVQRRKGKELRALNFVRSLLPNPERPGTMLVQLTKGLFAIVDAADAAEVGRVNWHARKAKKKCPSYAQRTRMGKDGKTVVTSLHHFLWKLWGMAESPILDHKNGNGLDCTRENIRAATANDNARNVEKRSNNTSGFKGVSFHKATGKFSAQIVVNRKLIHLGLFQTAVEAAMAYNSEATKRFGEFAKLNAIAGGARLKPRMPEENH